MAVPEINDKKILRGDVPRARIMSFGLSSGGGDGGEDKMGLLLVCATGSNETFCSEEATLGAAFLFLSSSDNDICSGFLHDDAEHICDNTNASTKTPFCIQEDDVEANSNNTEWTRIIADTIVEAAS